MSPILYLLTAPLFAGNYTFHKVIDTAPGSEYSSFHRHLIVNNEGVVALTATRRRDGRQVVLRGVPGSMRVVVEESDEIRAPVATDMNDSGVIVYVTENSIRTVAPDGSSRLVALGRLPDFLFVGLKVTSFPSINNDGTVAFTASNRVYAAASGESPRMVVSETDIPRWFANTPAQLTGARINNRGVIAFHALGTANPSREAVYLKGEGPPVLAIPIGPGWPPPLGDDGALAIQSRTGRGGVTIVRDGVFADAVSFDEKISSNALALGMSNSGKLVFGADASDAPAKADGLFAGGDLERQGVIANGDPLFGSTVWNLYSLISYHPRLVNDRGQIIFSYTLTSFVSGVALADPGEEEPPGIPVIHRSGIRNRALAIPATERGQALAPGTAVSIFGRNFAPSLEVSSKNAMLPTSSGGVTVTFNGIEAPVFFAAQGQIDVLVPYELKGATSAEVKVYAAGGESAPVTVSIAPHSPAIYSLGSAVAHAVYTGSEVFVAAAGATPDSRPARPGDRISLFANGLGEVTPGLPSGANSCEDSVCAPDQSNEVPRHAAVKPTIQIAGTSVPEENIRFAGLDGRTPGLFRIDFTLPSGLPSGAQSIVLRQGNYASPDRTVGIALR